MPTRRLSPDPRTSVPPPCKGKEKGGGKGEGGEPPQVRRPACSCGGNLAGSPPSRSPPSPQQPEDLEPAGEARGAGKVPGASAPRRLLASAGVRPAAPPRRGFPSSTAPRSARRSQVRRAPGRREPGRAPRPQRANATCGSNVRRRGPGAPSRAGRRASAAAGRGSPRAPRRRAAPAGTRRRARTGGWRRASGSPSTSRSRRASRGTGPVPPERPKWRCLPAPGSAGSERTSRRVPRRWPPLAQKRARSPRPLYGARDATLRPPLRPWLPPFHPAFGSAWPALAWLSINAPFARLALGAAAGAEGRTQGPKTCPARPPSPPRLGLGHMCASARAPTFSTACHWSSLCPSKTCSSPCIAL